MRRLSASKLALAMECSHPWSGGLEWKESSHASARLGNAIHALAERHVLDGTADVDGVALEFSLQPAQRTRLGPMFAHWRAWAAEQDTSTWRVEQAFAIDPVTGSARILPSKHHRDYSAAKDHEVCGTADVVDVTPFGVTVRDYKSGVWVDHPSESAQMRALAFAVSRVHQRSDATASIVRLTPDGVHEVEHHFDALELAMIDDELHELHRRRQMPVGPTPSATACKFCPVRHACPENFYHQKETASHEHA